MKAGLVLAAGSAVLGTGQCAVHKLKLQKIPLAEQLQHADIATHAKSLYSKYTGQKFMGSQADAWKDRVKDTSIHVDKEHPVPVDNFLNAQCTSSPMNRVARDS